MMQHHGYQALRRGGHGDGVDAMSTRHRIVEAFLAGETPIITDHLALQATFHSPVTDYHGPDRIANVLAAVAQVMAHPRLTRRLDGPEETAAFFTVIIQGRHADGMLLVAGPSHGPANDLTLMIRPLKPLLLGIEQITRILPDGGRGQSTGFHAAAS